MPEDMSPGEIGRHLGRLEAQIDAGFKDIKTDLSNYVLKSVHEAEMRGVEQAFHEVRKDIEDQQSRVRWVVGLTIPSLVAIVIAVLNVYF